MKKLTTDFPTIKEMERDIHNLKTCTQTFEYLTEAFWLNDELEESISESNLQNTQFISSVLLTFQNMNERINHRVSYIESMIEQAGVVEIKVEDENENSLLN